jgi:hypothetical protein
MVERRTASAPGGAPRAPAQPIAGAGDGRERHQTERVAVRAGAAQLPNWFWGALGCLSVLGVGFTVMLMVGRPAAEAPRPAVVATPSLAPAPPQVIQVEQLAPPPPPPAPVHRAAPRPIKVARSPSAAPAAAAQAAPAVDDDSAVEAAFGITADPDGKADVRKPEVRKADDGRVEEGSVDDDEPTPRRKARAQAAAPAVDSETPETP